MGTTASLREEEDVILSTLSQNFQNALRAVMRHAGQTRGRLHKLARDMASEIGLNPDVSVQLPCLKTLARTFEKAVDKHGGRVDEVHDTCRLLLAFDDPDQILQLRKIFGPGKRTHPFSEKINRRGIELLEFDDYFANPKESGYRGMNLAFSFDLRKGRTHNGEIKVIHRDMFLTDHMTYENYCNIRRILDRASGQDRDLTPEEKESIEHLQAANKALYDSDCRRLGLNVLLDPALHRKHTAEPGAPEAG